jgi:hypothetical protein
MVGITITTTASTATAATATIAICSKLKSTFYKESELFLTATTAATTEHSHLLKRSGNVGFGLLKNCNEVTSRLRVLCGEVSIGRLFHTGTLGQRGLEHHPITKNECNLPQYDQCGGYNPRSYSGSRSSAQVNKRAEQQ